MSSTARHVLLALAATVVAVALMSCASSSPRRPSPASPSHSVAVSPSLTPTPSPAGASPGGGSPAITVLQAGGSASTQGFSLVAVLEDSSAEGAADITVSFTVSSRSGQPPVTAHAALPQLAAGETQAVVTSVSLPSGYAVAGVTATASAGSAAPIPSSALTATNPQFQANAYAASVAVSLTNNSANAQTATVVVACFDSAGHVIGGGEQDGLRTTAGGAVSVNVTVSVPRSPDHCQAFARPSS